MTWWSRYYFGCVTPHRARWLSRGFLIFLALDIWANMFVRAGRYGVEGFNVAHFGWLDAILPVPTPGFYLGTITIASAGAFVAGLTGLGLRPVLITALTFNLGWCMSLLDSYQHHYLLGLLALCMLGFTWRTHSPTTNEPADARTWGFPLVCTVMAIVYLFAAVSKLDAVWRSGDVIQRIAGARARPMLELWAARGGTPDQFWTLAAHAVVLAEMFLVVAFLVAPLADRGHRAARVTCTVGLIGAFAFHAGVEWVDLSIEWFSYYLFFLAAMCLGPAKLLEVVGERIDQLGTVGSEVAQRWLSPPERSATLGVLSVLATVLAGLLVDLPGVTFVCTTAAFAMLARLIFTRTVADKRLRTARALVAGGVCAFTMVAVVELADTRYHYYRYVGGDALRRAQQTTTVADRRGLLEDALGAYVKANRYAPEDEDRVAKERDVRSLLSQLPPAAPTRP